MSKGWRARATREEVHTTHCKSESLPPDKEAKEQLGDGQTARALQTQPSSTKALRATGGKALLTW